MGYARVQREPFVLDTILADLAHEEAGGVTLYVGTVRGRENERRIQTLEYEAFGEMAEATLDALRKETILRFGLTDAVVVHRTGPLKPKEPILCVALAGRHRTETYDAIRYFMDRLKETVPIWKLEEGDEGATWILGAEQRRTRA